MSKKKLLILYTGGTIGMQKDALGQYKPVPGLLAKQMHAFHPLHQADMPEYTIKEYIPLLDSSNIGPTDWLHIAKDIEKDYEHYDGFLILHGTDTLAFSASALSFILRNLAKPVIFTGSQVPLSEPHTDARDNLIHAMILAAHYPIYEVCLFFNNKLLRGNRSRKVNTYSFDAFASPNFPALAQVGIRFELRKDLLLAKPSQSLSLAQLKEASIVHLNLFPGFNIENVALNKNNLQAFILDSFGMGNAPEQDKKLLQVLKELNEKGVILVNHSQCLTGRVDMQSYSTGHILAQAGLLSAQDMTPESIICKLYYLLSQDFDLAEQKRLFQENLCGELTK